MLPLSPALEERLRRPDSTVRRFVVGDAIAKNADGSTQARVLLKPDDWGTADGASLGPPPTLANFQLIDNGDVRLAGTGSTLISKAGPPNAYFTDLDRLFPLSVGMLEWGGTQPAEIELKRIKIWLNPRVNGGQSRQVVSWKLELWKVTDFSDGMFYAAQIMDGVSVAVTNDAEGLVTFPFDSGPISFRPRPLAFTLGSLRFAPIAGDTLFIVVTALDKDGNGAANAGMGYDSGTAMVSSGGLTLSSRTLANPFPNLRAYGADGGAGAGCPVMTIDTETYTSQTISFITNPLNLGGAPTTDVQLVGRGHVPAGCTIVYEVRNDADSAWIAFTDGQWMTADLSLTPSQTRKMRATLNTNVAGGSNLTPTLTGLGMEAFTETNFMKQSRITGGRWAIDPQTMKGEIPEILLTFIRDGDKDYSDAITDFLANNHIGDIRFRLYWGDETLARKDWLHVDDLFVDGSHPKAAEISLKCLTPLVFLRDLLPRYKAGSTWQPDGDSSVGAWTTDSGGGANLFQKVDEQNFDDTDYIRSELTPSNSAYELTLPTPLDPTGRKHIVDYRYRKDATSGEQIDLTVQLRQGTTVIASLVHTNIDTDTALSATPASFSLTDEQVAQITNYPDLRLRFIANKVSGAGARRAVVTWAQFRLGGKQDQVSYNGTLKSSYDGIVANELGIDARYRGAGIVDVQAINQVGKTMFQTSGPNNKPFGKAELDSLAFIAGGGLTSEQGKICFKDMSSPGPVRAIFPSAEISLPESSPGYEERITGLFVKWRWNAVKGDFDRQEYVAHAAAQLHLGKARLDPATWVDDETSKWLSNEGLDSKGVSLAGRIGVRQVQALGPGLMLWPFRANYPHPELRPGDVISLQTDKFVGRDPTVSRAIRGQIWVTAVVQSIDVSAQEIAAWVRNYSDMLVDATNTKTTGDRLGLGPATPHIMAVKLYISESGEALAMITTNAATAVRVAASTAGIPSDATTRAAALQTLDASGILTTGVLLNTVPDDVAYVKVFAYEKVDGSGLESPAATATVKMGTRKRGFIFDDGLYSLKASNATGVTADPTVRLVPEVGIFEGGVVQLLYRHREEITVNGADADGDVPVTFAQVYQNAPMVVFKGGQYVGYSNTLPAGKQRLRLQPVDVTASGFTARAQILVAGVTTAQTDDFPSGNELTAVDETAEADLTPGGANDDTYTVHYFVSVTLSAPGVDPNVTLTVAIDTNDGSGWQERATFVYSRASSGTSTWSHEQKPIVVIGLGTNDDIRVRAKSFVVHDATGSFKVRGGDAGGSNPETYNGVTYTTAADTIESAIPSAGDNVTWVAQEVT